MDLNGYGQTDGGGDSDCFSIAGQRPTLSSSSSISDSCHSQYCLSRYNLELEYCLISARQYLRYKMMVIRTRPRIHGSYPSLCLTASPCPISANACLRPGMALAGCLAASLAASAHTLRSGATLASSPLRRCLTSSFSSLRACRTFPADDAKPSKPDSATAQQQADPSQADPASSSDPRNIRSENTSSLFRLEGAAISNSSTWVICNACDFVAETGVFTATLVRARGITHRIPTRFTLLCTRFTLF